MKTRLFPIALSLLAVAPAMAGPEPVWKDKIERGGNPVVMVNGEGVTSQDLYAVVMRRYARQTLSEMIQRLLVEQGARKAGVEVTAAEVEARYQAVRQPIVEEARRQAEAQKLDMSKFNPEQVFTDWVNKSYFGPEEFRLHLRTSLLSGKVVRNGIILEDKDLTAYKARVITFLYDKHSTAEATQLAEGVLKKLKAGADFAALAKEGSEDDLKNAGGALPEFYAGSVYRPIEPDAAAAIMKLQPGQVSPIFQGQLGCYVLKLDSIQASADLDPVQREKLRQRITEERVQVELNFWLQQVKARVKVEIKDKRFE